MNKNSAIRWMALVLLVIPTLLWGQAQPYLSLEKAVELSAKNNTSVQTAELDRRIAKANRQQTDAIFLPQVSIGYQAMFSNDPLNAFGFLLQQRQVTAADFDPNKLNDPGNAHNYSASLDFQMPLLNLDLVYARKGARLQEEMYGHQAKYTQDFVRFEVQKAYTQLQLAYQSRDILNTTLNDVRSIYESVSRFYEQGLLHKSDVLNAQVQVNTIETALSKATSNIANASDGLRLLLGEENGADAVVYQADSLQQRHQPALDKAFTTERADIQAMQKALEAAKMNQKSAAMAFVPSINAFGNYQFHDEKFFGFKEDAYLVGVSLKWKIFTGNQNRSKHRAAKWQHEKMQREYDLYLNKSRMELEKNRRELADLQTAITQQQTSVAQAAEALRIMSNRHQEGLVSTTDLLLAQAQHSQQRLALAQAIMNYNIAGFYQDILTNHF